MLLPKRIHAYIAAEVTTPTLLGMFLFSFLLLMNRFFFVAEQALSKNLGWGLTAELMLLFIPNLLVMVIPMSVLLGCLIGIGRLSADHEWVAIQSAGHGPWRMLRPVGMFGLLCSIIAFVVYAEVVPWSTYALRNLTGRIVFASNLASDLKPRFFYSNLPNVVLFVDEIVPSGTPRDTEGRLEGVLVVKTDPDRDTHQLFLARSGDLYPSPDRTGALLVDLYNGVAHLYGGTNEETYQVATRYDTASERIDPAAYLQALLKPPQKVVQDFSIREVLGEFADARDDRDRIRESVAQGDTGSQVKTYMAERRATMASVELHSRAALPMASFFLSILAMPLGITRVRSGKGAGFAMSLLVILVYWSIFTFARDQSVAGKIPAWLGPWMANLVVAVWASWGIWRLHRPASGGRGGVLALVVSGLEFTLGILRLLSFRTLWRVAKGDTAMDLGDLGNLGGTEARFVGRLDQYVGFQFIRILLLSLLASYAIFALVESKNLMDSLLRTKQSFSLLLEWLQYFVPGVLHVVLPISCLIGAVVAFTVLARTGELTAIKAAGVSMRRVTAPVILLTALLCGFLYYVTDFIAPSANQRLQEVKDRIDGKPPRTYGLPVAGRWAFGPKGQQLYHYRLYDPDREEFQGLRVLTIDRDVPRILDHRFAEKARWRDDHWELEGGWYRSFPSGGEITYEKNDGIQQVALAPPSNFTEDARGLGASGTVYDQLSLIEIREQIVRLLESGYDVTQLRVAFHVKLARTVSPLVMVLLGLPFAFKVGRRGSLYGIGVAMLLVIVYWATFAVFNALGLETILDPRVAAWAPNILYGLLGIYLLLYVRT